LNTLDAKRSSWAETAQEIEVGLRQGKENNRLLAWVRSQMLLQLTETEQQCITLYYFRALNYRQAGTLLHMNPSSVYRAVRRGTRKLKKAAQQSGIGPDTRRGIQKPMF
jgi:DNA-directed RNA polymerase specialized sigma24 family protein